MASSSGMARADEVMAKLGKARVKKSATNWSWEDEEMMYEYVEKNILNVSF